MLFSADYTGHDKNSSDSRMNSRAIHGILGPEFLVLVSA